MVDDAAGERGSGPANGADPEVEVSPSDSAQATASYIFDPADVASAVALVDDALGHGFDSWTAARQISTRSIEVGLPPDAPLVRELVYAVSYQLRLAGPGKVGCALGPTTPDGPIQRPPAISSVSDDALRLWEALARGTAAPAGVARFEDLLFCRRVGNGMDRATRAAEAYLELSGDAPLASDEMAMERTEALVRAWDLARSVRMADMDSRIRIRMAGHVREVLNTTPSEHPGIVLPLLAALTEGPLRAKSVKLDDVADPIDVDALLDSAARAFHLPHVGSEVAGLRRRRTTDRQKLDGIARDEVAVYLAQANAAPEAAVRMVHLESAAQVARDRGLNDLVRQATAQMQGIQRSDLNLQHVSASVEIPHYIPEGWLAPFVRSRDWREGIEVFLAYPPPTGPLEALQEAERSTRDSVARRLFSSVMLNRDALPRSSTRDEKDRIEYEIAHTARIQAENHGQLLAGALWRMEERYGVPSEDELTVQLSRNGVCDAQLARSLAKAFRHFWAGDFESCVHLVTPKIEAAARSLLRELDEGVYRVQKGAAAGGYPGLGVLLGELNKLALDESWAYFLGWLLHDRYGMNLRNEVAHGFLPETSPIYAALTLRAAGLLVTVAGPSREDGGGSSVATPTSERSREDLLALLRTPNRPSGPKRDHRLLDPTCAVLGRLWWSAARARAVRQVRKSETR